MNRFGRTIVILSILVAAFWISVAMIKDVYAIAWVGALFELVSLPAMLLTIVIPVILTIKIFKRTARKP